MLADQDGDKKLSLSEFISLPLGTVENQQAQDIDDDWVRERKKEFEEVIDSNLDGIVTMEELEVRDVKLSCRLMYNGIVPISSTLWIKRHFHSLYNTI